MKHHLVSEFKGEFWLNKSAAICEHSRQAARDRQQTLTKPAGSLGVLEELAICFAGFQKREIASIHSPLMLIFAADHGICAQQVSAFPQEVTLEMLANFAQGGAAINQLCQSQYVPLRVINAGCAANAEQLEELKGIEHYPVACGTQDFSETPAMSYEQNIQALALGAAVVEEQKDNLDLLLVGEMGIGNTAASTAMAAALTGLSIADLVGAGTGLEGEGLKRKQRVLERSLGRVKIDELTDAQIMLEFGGFEIAAMAGAYIRAAQLGIPSLIDGFIATAAALWAIKINPSVKDWFIFSHCSNERGHKRLLDYLNATPLLDLGLRLGEGTGAALALPLIKQALNLHANMATFEQAQVSEKTSNK